MVETFYWSKVGVWSMSASNKFLIFAVVFLVAVIGYLEVDHLGWRLRRPRFGRDPARPPRRHPPILPLHAPAPAPTAAASTDEAATRQAYTECVSGLFPTQADAQSPRHRLLQGVAEPPAQARRDRIGAIDARHRAHGARATRRWPARTMSRRYSATTG